MEYHNFKIIRFTYQGCANYKVITPQGITWNEVFNNVRTAKKHIDAYRIEIRKGL